MNNDPIVCGGAGPDHVVSLRCPDHGRQDCDVVEWDRREGVIRVRCPKCAEQAERDGRRCEDLFTAGFVPASEMRPKPLHPDPTTMFPAATPGEDDGE